MVAHAAFSMQEVKALTAYVVFSALTAVVYQEAAADTVTITLRRDTSDARRRGDREFQRPRQWYSLNIFRVTVGVEIADIRRSPRWTEDLVPQDLGFKGLASSFLVSP